MYAVISLLSFLILLPLVPFMHKVHCSLIVITFSVFIVSTTYVWLTPPFTPDMHIKVFFAQKVNLTNVTSAVLRPQLTHAIMQLNIIEGYGTCLMENLPSSWFSINNSEGVQCIVNLLHQGLMMCEWPVLLVLLPSIADTFGGDKGMWLVANVMCLKPVSLHVEIEGIQMQACTISVEKYGIRHYSACTHKEGGTTRINTGTPMTWTDGPPLRYLLCPSEDKTREELDKLLHADDVISMRLLCIEFDSELLFAAACSTWLHFVTRLKYVIDPSLFPH